MRNHLLCAALAVMACGGDWLSGPGTPMELAHESLKGRWVHTSSVHTVIGSPSTKYRHEFSPDEGSIMEFDGAGGVQHFRYAPDAGPGPLDYTIRGDTLTMFFDYAAEVSTTRLVLTLDSGVLHDFDGDGDEELAIEVTTHQRARD
ncbi:MAG TPA: hypothetical protein VNO19_05715 [Gemmatimonadales bacterium]|nr:hypothetical protein [Gemmatimonadales bacterium]